MRSEPLQQAHMGKLCEIACYPIKSLAGQRRENAMLHPQHGIKGDRQWAISKTNGLNNAGDWLSCAHFDRLTINASLATYQLNETPDHLVWTSPSGEQIILEKQRGKLSPQPPANGNQLVAANKGYWDHEDAHLSIINLNTVRDISERIGHVIDPARFRANLYIEAPAWAELS